MLVDPMPVYVGDELSPQALGALESEEICELLLFFGQNGIENIDLPLRIKVSDLNIPKK